MVGTLKSDQKGIPKEMKGVADREEKSTSFCYSEDEKTMLLSYIDKTKKGKKNILALTTMHNQVKLSVDERKKPHALVFFDHIKGGIDVVDLISAKMLTRMKTRRWTLNVFAFILDSMYQCKKHRQGKHSNKATQHLPVHLGTTKIASKKLHSATP